MTPTKKIDEQTRREIAELLTEWGWSGGTDELSFLGSLYDLESLPSHDYRFRTAHRDIKQHLDFNDFEDRGWVFTDPRFEFLTGTDEVVLRFVARRLHPHVCRESHKEALLPVLNQLLAPCGYELFEQDSPTGVTKFSYRSTTNYHPPQPPSMIASSATLGDPESLRLHLKRIEQSITTDPSQAIGSSKELVEDVCAQILNARGAIVGSSDNLGQKFKAVVNALDLDKSAVPGDVKASEAATKIIRQLAGAVHSLGELRNTAGTGHGSGRVPSATPREARLAFNSAVTICEYLFGLWEEVQP
ncbi:abortive infection family protein [Rhodococcus sp. D-6]|uniref:Abortive infection family protein n=1 Tax=Rhodococcus sp. D-6 TaxID=1387842 RepID=A0AAU7V3J2_9NOCA